MSHDELAAALQVDADPARALTLPARAFLDPAVLELELERLFLRTWLPVPERAPEGDGGDRRSLVECVARRGGRAPFALLGRPLFLQRDWKGALRALPNVCTHAWHTLIEGPGRERFVVCPQHGRQFDCDGRFRLQPGFERGHGFPRPEDHLAAFPVESFASLLFTCLGRPLASFRDAFAPMARSTARLGLARFVRAPRAEESREVEGNWKLHAWNYMDRFHIGFVHRAPGGLADAVAMGSYRTELGPWSALQWVYATDPASGFEPDTLPARFRARGNPGKRVFALWWFLFPNLAFNFYPWGLSLNAWLPVPGQPERTRFLWYHLVRDPRRYRERESRWLASQVDAEDVEALAQVARGVRSGLAPRGRFAPAEESGPHWFHRRVYETLFPASDHRPPGPVAPSRSRR